MTSRQKLLISGCSGFLGTNLVERLGSWCDVVGVDLRKPVEYFAGTTFIQGDLTDKKFVETLFRDYGPFDEVIHVAAQALLERSFEDPMGTYQANVGTALNILDRAKEGGAKRVIALSSEVVYGKANYFPTREGEPVGLRPTSPYTASKIAVDVLAQQMNGRGLRTVVIRPGMMYGERSPPGAVVTKFMLRLMDGQPLRFPTERVKHPTRDLVYILDFVNGVRKILENPVISGVYNLGSGREVSMPDLAKAVVRAVIGKDANIKQWLAYDSQFAYRPEEIGMRTLLDTSKAKKDFGYSPEWSLESGLRRTYSWLRGGGRAYYGW